MSGPDCPTGIRPAIVTFVGYGRAHVYSLRASPNFVVSVSSCYGILFILALRHTVVDECP